MSMGITRVAEQYGLLAESQAHREQLAFTADAARAIAATQRGHSITPGLNDPRRMQAGYGSGYGGTTLEDMARDWGMPAHELSALSDFRGDVATPLDESQQQFLYDYMKNRDTADDPESLHAPRFAGYGDGSGIDTQSYHTRQYGESEHPWDEGSHQSGYDPEGDWQDHRNAPIGPQVVGALYDDDHVNAEFGGRDQFNRAERQRETDKIPAGHDEYNSEYEHGYPDDGPYGDPPGVGGMDLEQSKRQFGGTPEDDDGFPLWQTNMDDGTWGSDNPPEFEHMAPASAFAEHADPEPADFGYGDEAYSNDPSWESGLDRPFTGAVGPDQDPTVEEAIGQYTDPVYGGDPSYHDPVRR